MKATLGCPAAQLLSRITLRADRWESTDQRQRADSSEPIDANEPTDKTDSAEPTEPMENTDPTDPMLSIDPFEQMLNMESSDHSDHMELDPSDTEAMIPSDRTDVEVEATKVARDTASGCVAEGRWAHSCVPPRQRRRDR